MNVLILDGPQRGKLCDITGRMFQVPRMLKLNLLDFDLHEDESTQFMFQVDTYYVHRFRFMDRTIRVASLNPVKPKDSAVYSLILSAKAKKAMEND